MNRRRFLAASAAAPALLTGSCSRYQTIPGSILGASHAAGHRLRQGIGFPKPTREVKTDVVIAGGGIAGLAAARRLRQLGVANLQILDLEHAVGGASICGSNSVSAYPWGAHYVPLPGKDCREVLQFFEEIQLITGHDAAGRPIYDELALCHDPQERLFMHGEWQEGLAPTAGLTKSERDQFIAFASEIERWKSRQIFTLPVDRSKLDPEALSLDTITMAEWMARHGFDCAPLLWQVDYSCQDDFGGNLSEVSAWAGIHYFASRTGEAANAEHETVLTWPSGNGWLVDQLKLNISDSIRPNQLIYQITPQAHGADVLSFDTHLNEVIRYKARSVICALPRFIAQRIIPGLAPISGLEYSPWVVINLTLDELPPSPGVLPAWDNVIYGSSALGYVNAGHQSLSSRPIETVITHYEALSGQPPAKLREWMHTQNHHQWVQRSAEALKAPHPDLSGHIKNADIWLWGHGMIRPKPGFLWGKERQLMQEHRPPIYFAHSDMSGMSLFEEAYTRGITAAETLHQAF
jgi:hypothetical protein